MLEAHIRTVLTGDSAVAALVGTRVRPLVAAQNDKRPHLVYSVDSSPIPTYGGSADIGRATVTVSIVADTYTGCAELSAEVRRVLDHHVGTNNGTQVIPALMDEESDIEEGVEPGTEKPVYVRTQTYRALYRDA